MPMAGEMAAWTTGYGMLTKAIDYAQAGYRVFPLQPGRKLPVAGSHGCNDATDDTDQIETWWTATPGANIGLATDGLVVLDLEAESQWAKDEQRLHDLLGTGAPCQATANGGK